jgi:hypothetical protein
MNNLKTLALAILITIPATQAQPEKQNFKHDFSVGLEGFHYHYSESVENRPQMMDDKGMMYGINGSYQLTYKESVFVRPEARVVYGFTQYTNDKNSKYPQASVPNLIFEPRLLIGGRVTLLKNSTLFPYIGLGYRYKSDDGSQNRSYQNTSLNKRISQYWYLPVGTRFQLDFNQHWNLQGMIEYDWLISGRQFSYDTTKYPSPLVFKQTHGKGFKGELLIGRSFEKVSLAAGPYLHYWKIQKTKKVAYNRQDDRGRVYEGDSYEPDNVTREIGLKMTISF